MMRKVYLMMVLLTVLFQISCKKEEKGTTKKDLLCAVTWKYAQYYTEFNQQNTTLVYSIYKPQNLQDLSRNRIKYNLDGTFYQVDKNGATSSGTYSFNESNNYITATVNQQETVTRLLLVDDRGFQWGSLDGSIVAVMMPE